MEKRPLAVSVKLKTNGPTISDLERRMNQRRKRGTKGREMTKPYAPTPKERDAIEGFNARRKGMPPSPRLKVSKRRGVTYISTDHADPGTGHAVLMQVLGSADPDFVDGLLGQLAKIGITGSEVDERGINFVLSVVKGIEPRDQLEAMLAAQMAVIHSATMTFARRLNHVETIQQQDSAERAFNKLARTFAMQMEA